MAKFCKTAKIIWKWHEISNPGSNIVDSIQCARQRTFKWSNQGRKNKTGGIKKRGGIMPTKKEKLVAQKYKFTCKPLLQRLTL